MSGQNYLEQLFGNAEKTCPNGQQALTHFHPDDRVEHDVIAVPVAGATRFIPAAHHYLNGAENITYTVNPTDTVGQCQFAPEMFQNSSGPAQQPLTAVCNNQSDLQQSQNLANSKKRQRKSGGVEDSESVRPSVENEIINTSPIPDGLQVDDTFLAFEDLLDSIQTFAKQYGFKVGRSTHSLKYDEAKRLFNIPHQTAAEYERDRHCCLPIRGWFYCTKGGKSCPFRLYFVFEADKMTYRISETCGQHNHQLAVPDNSSIVHVQHEFELKQAEREFIVNIGPFIELDLLQKQLGVQFPNRQFDSSLIQMLKARGNQIHRRRQDPESLNQLLALGKKIESVGGVFSLNIDCYFRLAEVHIQTAAMKQYTAKYGDFTNVESIDQLPIKGYKYVIFKNVDCFNREVLTGISIIHWEHFTDLSKPLGLFGLDREPHSTIMTDDEPVYHKTAEAGNFMHLLSHKSTDKLLKSLEATFDKSPQDSAGIRSCVHRAIYDPELSPVECDKLLGQVVNSSASNGQGFFQLMTGFIGKKRKLCAAYRLQMFGSALIGDDSLKFPVAAADSGIADLFSLVKNQLSIFEKCESEIEQRILDIIDTEEGALVPHLKAHMDAVCSADIDCTIGEICGFKLISNVKYECRQVQLGKIIADSNRLVHQVWLPSNLEPGTYPSCDCNRFKSTKLPCAAIIMALKKLKPYFKVAEIIESRWNLNCHPAYQKKVNFVEPIPVPVTADLRAQLEKISGHENVEIANACQELLRLLKK